MAYTYGNTQNAAERIKEISGVNPLKCMKCGKCSATCPAFNEMDIKPHQFVTYVQNGDIEALAQSKSLWKCLSCFACVERCPRDVKPGKLIDAARQLVVRERGQNYLTADEIPELLDEATSYTDPENEAVIQEAISRLTKGKTLIVIAHRLSTIIDSDQIVVVKNGTIQAKGTHEELLKECSLYHTMWTAHMDAKEVKTI